MQEQQGKRRHDPERKQRIIDAALETIQTYGVTGTTHRRIAATADVPLGSMTYHFDSLDHLLCQAFTQLAERSSAEILRRLDAARSREEALETVVDIIAGNIWSTPQTLLLSFELYAYAARKPEFAVVVQYWMSRSRESLGRHFDPLTARALDALIEGIGIHNSADKKPLKRKEIAQIVYRLVPN